MSDFNALFWCLHVSMNAFIYQANQFVSARCEFDWLWAMTQTKSQFLTVFLVFVCCRWRRDVSKAEVWLSGWRRDGAAEPLIHWSKHTRWPEKVSNYGLCFREDDVFPCASNCITCTFIKINVLKAGVMESHGKHDSWSLEFMLWGHLREDLFQNWAQNIWEESWSFLQ